MKSFASRLALPLLLTVSCSSAALAAGTWDQRVFDANTQTETTWPALAAAVQGARIVDLGEVHYTPAVQAAEARVLRESYSAATPFILGWEFMNAADQARISQLYAQVRAGTLDTLSFLTRIAGAGNEPYVPVFEAARDLGAEVFGLNLPREQKDPIVAGGLAAADPQVIPPGFELGGAGYFDRFVAAMGGHGDPALIQNYFAAQCLTDDVMAYNLLQAPTAGARVIVNGDFHSDYFDAGAKRLRLRAPGQKLVTIHFVDSSSYVEAELLQQMKDPVYGVIADYVIYVNEPVTP